MPLSAQVKFTLAGGVFHGACYGIFFILSVCSIYLMLLRKRGDRATASNPSPGNSGVSLPILYGATALLFTVTGNWAFGVARMFASFSEPEQTDGFIHDWGSPIELTESTFLLSSIIVGDLILVYRTWVIWGYKKVMIAFPAFCIVCFGATSIATAAQLAQFKRGDSVFNNKIELWSKVDFALTLGINLYCTFMIAFKLWMVNHQLRKHGIRSSVSIVSMVAIFVESAMIYTFWSIFYFICYMSGAQITVMLEETVAVVSGISSQLISARVGLGWASKAAVSGLSSIHSGAHSTGYGTSRAVDLRSIPMSMHDDHSDGTGEYAMERMKKSPTPSPMSPKLREATSHLDLERA